MPAGAGEPGEGLEAGDGVLFVAQRPMDGEVGRADGGPVGCGQPGCQSMEGACGDEVHHGAHGLVAGLVFRGAGGGDDVVEAAFGCRLVAGQGRGCEGEEVSRPVVVLGPAQVDHRDRWERPVGAAGPGLCCPCAQGPAEGCQEAVVRVAAAGGGGLPQPLGGDIRPVDIAVAGQDSSVSFQALLMALAVSMPRTVLR